MNDNEMSIAKKYENEGWTVIHGGAPDFLLIKSIDKKIMDIMFIEVKTPITYLSSNQETYKKIIEEVLKVKYKLEVVRNGSSLKNGKSTTLSIKPLTRGRLIKFGHTEMNWDEVLNKLMDHAEKTDYVYMQLREEVEKLDGAKKG